MNDFEKILWGFIFSAIGVVFGWTLNQLGQWFRTRQEDKKNLKLVLFNLLETYFLFIRSDIEKIITKVTDKTFEKIPIDQQSEAGKKIMYAVYSGILSNHFKPELTVELQIIQKNYQESIHTLASIDPLTAYYLSGKTTIMERFDTIENWFKVLKEQYPNDTTTIESVSNKAMEIIKPDIVKEILEDLENDIKNIAWKINPVVFYRSKKAVNRLKSNATEQMDEEIDRLLHQLESVLIPNPSQ